MNSCWKQSLVHGYKFLVLILKLKIGWSFPNGVDVQYPLDFRHRSKLLSHSAAVLNLTTNAVTCITAIVWDFGAFVRTGLRITQNYGTDYNTRENVIERNQYMAPLKRFLSVNIRFSSFSSHLGRIFNWISKVFSQHFLTEPYFRNVHYRISTAVNVNQHESWLIREERSWSALVYKVISSAKRKLRTVTYTDLLRFRGAKDIWKDKIPYLIKPQRVKASLSSFEEKLSDQKGNWIERK